METPLVISQEAPTDCPHVRSEPGQMICYQANLMVLNPGPEPQSLSAEKIQPYSSLLIYVPHRSSVVREDLNRPTAKGREEGLESQTYRPQFQQISLKHLFHRRPMTLDLQIPQMSNPP
ncbi:hypothetical protein NDU88_005695 [Pleurodeles waltl]|uniref:Uncharacterized protein n=1 Tax=Pleurodeles waltl TaxID=8319 RepID=A0AAV7WYL3_PLEWA|nr:hypothetical protein NDU88_005695 [Pleurodeles waltl]